MDQPELLTKKEVARRLGISESTVDLLRRRGRIRFCGPIGNRYFFPRVSIEEFIRNNEVAPCHVEAKAPDSAGSPSDKGTISNGRKTDEPSSVAAVV